jgi:hypothetical protein
MRKPHVGLLSLAVGLGSFAGLSAVQAAPINLFTQNGAPSEPNISIAVNNASNMSGGGWVGGSTANYPISNSSPVLDNDVTTGWNAGLFSGGGMCNVGITQGYYDAANYQNFTAVPFDAIGTIRLWAQALSANDGTWISFPHEILIAYTTDAPPFNTVNNGGSYSSGTLGIIPSYWNTIATVTSVNGAAPTAPADSTDYPTSGGWVAGDFSQDATVDGSGNTIAYMDLAVNIPAGATSVMVSFGQDNASTGNQGGLAIQDIQAFAPIPEPTSFTLLGLSALGLLARRRRS